jgi:hypothetical protein
MYYYATILTDPQDIDAFTRHINPYYWALAVNRQSDFVYFPQLNSHMGKVDIGNCAFLRVELKLPAEFFDKAIELLHYDRRCVL